ncbi:MAG: hypothetical protein JXB62_10230 [Pirellulales bacterium]|nr:hypothetical protein [Pirellulales bacterium]
MSDSPSAFLFPLPLAPFERYMLADDRPGYPMTFVLRLQMAGRVRRSPFEAALEESLARHPLLCAFVDHSRRRSPCWVSAGGNRPHVDWAAAAAPLRYPKCERIDLASEVGLRIWVRQAADTAQITCQFHHSCCDALGGLAFVGDLLAAYGMRTAAADRKPEFGTLDPRRLLSRGRIAARTGSPMARVHSLWGTLCEAARWFAYRPVPLWSPTPAEPFQTTAPPVLEIHTRTLDPVESTRLHAAAKQRGATVNDVLLRDLFLAVNAWNERPGAERQRSRIRISMPVNLRGPEDDQTPAANMVTMSFLTRASRECGNRDSLLEGIRRETDWIKRSCRGRHFLRTLRMIFVLFGGLPRCVVGDRCLVTAVLSNLGDVSHSFAARFPLASGRMVAGDLVLEGVAGVPPIRPYTSASLMVSTYCDATTVALRWDGRRLSAGDAREFVDRYTARLRETLHRATT